VPTSEQRLRRLAEQAVDAQDPLRALESLVELRGELEAVTRAQARRALRGGRSFGDLARALGISRQAAHRRYRDLAAGQAPGQRRQVALTEQARRVLLMARQESLAMNGAGVGSEHVLIAVLRCGGTAAQTLVRAGVTLETARACERLIAADRARNPVSVEAAAGLDGILGEARRVAIARGRRWLDVQAVLLAALADRQGGAGRVLAAAGVDSASIGARLEREADGPSQATGGGLPSALARRAGSQSQTLQAWRKAERANVSASLRG